jgi:hypothetical protein
MMSISFGGSDKTTTTSQNQVSNPWAPTQPALKSLLGQIQGTSTAVTPTQKNAFSTLEANAAQGDPNAAATRALSTSLLNSRDNSGTVGSAYNTLQGNIGGIASGDVDPTTAPGMAGLLATIRNDVSNSVNGQFAAAGRDMSGANSQALARGISQGEAAPLLAQYNANVAAKTGAAGTLYNAGANTAATTQALDAARAGLQQQGVSVGDTALAQQNYAPNSLLSLEEQKTALPFSNMGLLASLLYPMAGLGGQVSGTGTSNTTGTNWSTGLGLLK